MRAAAVTRYGPPDVVEVTDLPQPEPGPDDVLIHVRATTVNRTDCGFRSGLPRVVRLFSGIRGPRHPVLGCEFAGVVAAVGGRVTEFRVGDSVAGYNDSTFGGHAEFVVADASGAIVAMPSTLDFASAAALLEGSHYALTYIKACKIDADSKVLVNGGTGAIGSAGIQIMHSIGADITATCRTQDMELVRGLGARHVISYEDDDFTSASEQFDLVFDAVGKSTFASCKPLLRPHGIYVSTELGPRAQNPLLAIATLGRRQRVMFPIPRVRKSDAEYLVRLAESGEFAPLIDRAFPLEDIVDAYRYVESGQKKGNVSLSL